jgi:integrase
LTRFLSELKKEGRAPRTLNRYHEALDWFLNWCVAQGWLEESPLRRLSKAPVGQKGKRKRRRAYTPEELSKLLGNCPEQRRVVYTVAAYSGFRRS